MSKLLVLGYYGRKNLGDESYITLMPKFFPNYSLSFISTDDLNFISESDYYGVIVGGGDIINEYFNSKIKNFLDKFNGPRIAFSIGVPFQSLINHEYFDHFDSVYVRNFEDISAIQKIIGNDRVNFTPDIGFSLSQTVFEKRENKVGVFLVGNIMRFPNIVKNLSKIILEISKDSEVVFYCFNPDEDVEISNKIMENVKSESEGAVISVDSNSYNNVEMINIISKLKFSLCMRYHAHVFSIASNTNIFSISATRKTRSLMKTGNLSQFQYEIPLNDYCSPTDEFDYRSTKKIYDEIKVSENTTEKYNRENRLLLKSMKQQDFFISCKPISERIQLLLEKKDVSNAARLLSYETTGQPDSSFNYGLIEKLLDVDVKSLTSIYNVVKEFSSYFRGLSIIKDIIQKGKDELRQLISPLKSNLFVDLNEYASYKDAHRGGWYLACEKLASFNRFNEIGLPKGIICDMYLDRTFHWASNYMKIINKIPYTAPWCGFIHHTSDNSYENNYNINFMFDNEDFLISLNTCVGLFALTKSLKSVIEEKLMILGKNIKVLDFTHPVDNPTVLFNVRRFQESVPKIINIGAWMRNPFTIYTTKLDPRFYHLKYALKGKDMNQYFPPDSLEFSVGVVNYVQEYNEITPILPCRPSTTPVTIWMKSLMEWLLGKNVKTTYFDGILYFESQVDYEFYRVEIPKMLSSVSVIEYLNNNLYDQMLSEFVVFLDLFDASAVNTILECIIRNTPVIVNRIPGTVDLLGENYPLFYNNAEDLETIGYQKIFLANKYLKNLNKDKYQIDYFVKDVISKT